MIIPTTSKMRDVITLAVTMERKEFVRIMEDISASDYQNYIRSDARRVDDSIYPVSANLTHALRYGRSLSTIDGKPLRSFDELLDNDLQATIIAFRAAAEVFHLDADEQRAIVERGL